MCSGLRSASQHSVQCLDCVHFSFVEKKTLDSLKDLSAIRYVSIMWLEVRWILS